MAPERKHFRIDLEALVRTRIISDGEAHELATTITSGHPSLNQSDSKLTQLNKQIQDSITALNSKDLQMGRLFDLFNQKINLLANELDIQKSASTSHSDESTTTLMPINLSGGGALIYSQKALEPGLQMELIITFIPEHVAIRCIAKSIKSFPVDDNPHGLWRIAIEFTHMHEDDQDRVVRKVLQEQTKQLRARRNNRPGQP
ncbi:MAG: PilZ domain-containing protein [Gammaproteobacteria bacterium]|jgi:hypothetical protein|nr:PilZ domain-containing protein [Gammaproteobacteria bacterium]